jgi:hypothetical protein
MRERGSRPTGKIRFTFGGRCIFGGQENVVKINLFGVFFCGQENAAKINLLFSTAYPSRQI